MYFSSRRAFTLLEVLIATGILGGALVALLSSVNNSARLQRRAVALLQQSTLATSKMTEILAISDLDINDRDNGDFEKLSGFEWSYEVEEVHLPFDEDAMFDKNSKLLKVTLTVKNAYFKTNDFTLPEYKRRDKTSL